MNDSRRLKIVVVNSLVAHDGADEAEIEQADRARFGVVRPAPR